MNECGKQESKARPLKKCVPHVIEMHRYIMIGTRFTSSDNGKDVFYAQHSPRCLSDKLVTGQHLRSLYFNLNSASAINELNHGQKQSITHWLG